MKIGAYFRDKVPLGRAIRIIILSVVFVSLPALIIFGMVLFFWQARAYDPKYNVIAIVQTGLEKEPLKSTYLAELLGLSIDRAENLYRIDLSLLEGKLRASPLIKEATLKRIPPGTLYIDYSIRKPKAFIGGFTNVAIDQEGVVIPFAPFFSPKKLPVLVLGIEKKDLSLGKVLDAPSLPQAFQILEVLEGSLKGRENIMNLERVDVSRASAESLGERQVIVIFDETFAKEGEIRAYSRTLILDPKKVEDGISRFFLLRDRESSLDWKKPIVFDARLESLAYIF